MLLNCSNRPVIGLVCQRNFAVRQASVANLIFFNICDAVVGSHCASRDDGKCNIAVAYDLVLEYLNLFS